MQVTIKTFAIIREILGTNQITLTYNTSPTITQILHDLTQQYPELKPIMYTEQHKVNPVYQFLHNDQTIPHEQLSIHTIPNGDTLIILPPAGGGATLQK